MKRIWSLIVLLTVMAPGAFAQVNTNGASAIEQALIEHACRVMLTAGAADTDPAYRECLRTRLRSLRADYGRDLSKVSAEDRNTFDSVCSTTRVAEGRQAYLECLTAQLVSLRNRRKPNSTASQSTEVAPPSESDQSAPLVIPEGTATSWLSPLWIGIGLVTLIAAIGGALLAVKGRRVSRKCRVCGGDVPQAGDLCPKCRREAAEALRQATAERSHHERALAEESGRQDRSKDEQRRQRAREDEAARLRQQEEARQREEDARRREREEEESRQRSRAAAVEDTEQAFDPHAILGVPRDASKEAIDAACQAARVKYAPDQVAHLGSELQDLYRRKAEAVERAYQILTA